MKLLQLFSIAALFLFSACGNQQTTEKGSGYTTEGFIIKKGLNTSHWLSQTEKRGAEREAYMSEKDFTKIAEMGFDHVRIPVDEMHLWDEAGKRHEDAFELLHNAIKWSFDNNLRVIIDLHVLRSHHFNTGNQRLWTDPVAQEQFWGFWKELSAELKQYPNSMLAYELLNEAVAEDSEDWNKLIAKGIETVRENEPERVIVVGSNKWQQVYTFKDLKVPADDKNLILSFHFYEPFIFTHYKASWTGILKEYQGPVHYPGKTVKEEDIDALPQELKDRIKGQNAEVYNKELFIEKFKMAKEVADKYGLQLYCGEFGCFPSTPLEKRVELYKDYMAAFDELDIAWTHWNYKNDFPVVDAESLEPIAEIVDVMISE